MGAARRTTIYLDPDLHRALSLKATASGRSISSLVHAAVRAALDEDAVDLEAFGDRRSEDTIDFETFVRALERRGRL